MNLTVGKKYKISLSIGGKILTYSCTIESIDDTFICFVDKFGDKYNYNKNLIISFDEIETEDVYGY